jgi:hypothetical protein
VFSSLVHKEQVVNAFHSMERYLLLYIFPFLGFNVVNFKFLGLVLFI